MLDRAKREGAVMGRHLYGRRLRQRGRHVLAGLLVCFALLGAAGCQASPQRPNEIPLEGTRNALPSQSSTPATSSKDPVGTYANFQRGFNIIPSGPNAYSTSEMLNVFTNLRALGVNAVTLTTQYVLATPESSVITPGRYTVSDDSLQTGIAWAHQMGLRTTLALYV